MNQLPIDVVRKIYSYDGTYKKIFSDILMEIQMIHLIKSKLIRCFKRKFFYIDNIRFSTYGGIDKCDYLKGTDFIDCHGNKGFSECMKHDKPHYHFHCIKTNISYKVYCKNITFYKALSMFKHYRQNKLNNNLII